MQSENERHTIEEKVRDNEEAMKRMETQIAELEQRVIGSDGTTAVTGFSSNVEVILKDQRDRYKRRVDELEVEEMEIMHGRRREVEIKRRWTRCMMLLISWKHSRNREGD